MSISSPPIANLLCPYCEINKTLKLIDIFLFKESWGESYGQCVFQCTNCQKISVFEVRISIPKYEGIGALVIKEFLSKQDNITQYLKVLGTFPPYKGYAVYNEAPKKVNVAFLEVQKAFKVGAINLAGGGCRKVLDLIFKNIAGDNLFEKIENSELPEIIKDWAHNIRLLGNILIHEDVNLASEEVEEIIEFTKIIIEYIYVFPTRAKALREKYEKFKTHN